MYQLMKLEIKKYKLKRYLPGILITTLSQMVFITLMFIDTSADPKQNLDTYAEIIFIINMLVLDTFLIFSSAFMSQIIINEYRDRTILVMFSYPISRKRIILTKLCMVAAFTMLGIFLSSLICTIYVIILDSFVNVLAGEFQFQYIINMFWNYVGSIVTGGFVSLIPFTFGMIKKKVTTTMVSSTLCVFLVHLTLDENPDFKNTVIKLGIIGVIAIVLVRSTLKKQIHNI